MSCNILVLSTPRVSSTYYCNFLSSLYNLKDAGEPWPLTQASQFYTRWSSTEDSKKSFDKANQIFFGEQDAIIKIHAGHVSEYAPFRPKGWFLKVVDYADDIHFLLRKDVHAQIQSLFVALVNGRKANYSYHDDWQEELSIPDTPQNRQDWEFCQSLIYNNVVGLSTIYQMLLPHNPKVVWYEDVAKLVPGKYHRPFKMEWEPEHLYKDTNYFNITEIFKANQDYL